MRKSSFAWSSRGLSVKRNSVEATGTEEAEVAEEVEEAVVDTARIRMPKMK